MLVAVAARLTDSVFSPDGMRRHHPVAPRRALRGSAGNERAHDG